MIIRFFDSFRRYPELKTGIVNLRSGTSFRGVIWGHRGPWLVLKKVEIVEERGKPVERKAVDGEVLVQLADVDFVQVL